MEKKPRADFCHILYILLSFKVHYSKNSATFVKILFVVKYLLIFACHLTTAEQICPAITYLRNSVLVKYLSKFSSLLTNEHKLRKVEVTYKNNYIDNSVT